MSRASLYNARAIRGLIAAAGLAVVAWATPAAQEPALSPACNLTTTERIVAIGDVHGAFDQFVGILREAGLVDRNRRWIGGKTVLVQTGDVLDRGPNSKQVLDLLRRLETDAAKAGGQVRALVGNHEVMRMVGDLRDVSAKEYSAFASGDARTLLDGLFTAASASERKLKKAAGEVFDEPAFRKFFYATTPLGLVEMHRGFAPTGEYGRWLRARDTIVRINGIVFVHGGISPPIGAAGCAAIDAQMRLELQAATLGGAVDLELVGRPDGPLWYRGLVDGTGTDAELEGVLAGLGARAIVVGHTVMTDNRIQLRENGRVIGIDTGMLAGEFYPNGVASALEIKDGVATAIYIGRRDVLGLVAGSKDPASIRKTRPPWGISRINDGRGAARRHVQLR